MNRLTLRQLVKLIMDAIGTRTLVTNEAVADAVEQYPDDPICVSVRKARALLAVRDNETERKSRAEMLYSYLNTKFDPALATYSDINNMLCDPHTRNTDMLNDDELRQLVDGIVPVAILAELIKKHGSAVKSTDIGFRAFCDNYGRAVVGTDEDRGVRKGKSFPAGAS